MKKILIAKNYNKFESEIYDHYIVLNDFYFLKDKKIIFLDLKVNQENKENFFYIKSLLNKFDFVLNNYLINATGKSFKKLKIFETCCMERLYKYSRLIDFLLKNKKLKSENVIFYFKKNDFEDNQDNFFYKFLYIYLKYFKKYKVLKVQLKKSKLLINGNFENNSYNYILFVLILFYKTINLLNLKYIYIINFFKKKKKKLFF